MCGEPSMGTKACEIELAMVETQELAMVEMEDVQVDDQGCTVYCRYRGAVERVSLLLAMATAR